MQISATNLLLAAQQTLSAGQPRKAAGDSFAGALGAQAPSGIHRAQFSPPSFEADAGEAEKPADAPQPERSSAPGGGHGAVRPPGSTLDIRV